MTTGRQFRTAIVIAADVAYPDQQPVGSRLTFTDINVSRTGVSRRYVSPSLPKT